MDASSVVGPTGVVGPSGVVGPTGMVGPVFMYYSEGEERKKFIHWLENWGKEDEYMEN
jgi:hypothetical protein